MAPWQIGLLLALVAVAGLAYLLWARSRAARRRAGLPAGEVVYADMEGWEACPPLYAPRWRLAGKPDYVLRAGGVSVPVEVKPGRRAARPYPADVLQLAAYCLLIEEDEGRPPPHGLLRYQDRTFAIPYDAALRERLITALGAMRQGLRADAPPRSHQDPIRCRHCGHRAICDQRLDGTPAGKT